jgi:hypothetical protein
LSVSELEGDQTWTDARVSANWRCDRRAKRKAKFPHYPFALRIVHDCVGPAYVHRPDVRPAAAGQRSRQVYPDGAEYRPLLFADWYGLIAHLGRPGLRWMLRALASFVLAMASAKLIEVFGGFNFGIDALFVRNPEHFGAVPTGRMAPMTALNFVFIATGLFALTGKQPAKFAGPLGALPTVIGAVVLMGYWYGTPLLYGGHSIPVALSTCGFFLSGIGLVMLAGPAGWPLRTFLGDSTRAVLLRAFVPLITAAALINGWINTTLPARIHVNPAVTSALCAVAFAGLIAADYFGDFQFGRRTNRSR